MSRLRAAREIASRQGWLSQTPPGFRDAVLDRCTLKAFSAGATIYMTGDPPGGMYGLISGGLSVTIATGEEGPNYAHFLRPGAWFGEGPMISGRPRIAGFVASRSAELLHLPLHGIDEILRENPSSWRLFAGLVLGKLEVALGAIDDLMIQNSRKRLIALLLRLGGCRFHTPPGAGSIEVDVSQEDLARMANVSRATASAILRPLSDAGKVELLYRRVMILSPDGLRTMLSGGSGSRVGVGNFGV